MNLSCSEKCICPECLERQFRRHPDLAETYLKTRKQVEQREKKWIQQDQEREIRRNKKREEIDTLLLKIDLEMKRRGSNKGEPVFSI